MRGTKGPGMMRRFLCALALVAFGAAPALADPKSDLMAAMAQFGKASSYHITALAKGRTMEADMALPAKMHIYSGPMEMIKIDQIVWVKAGSNWQKINMAALPGADQITNAFNGAIATAHSAADDVTVTDLGMKSPEGAPLHAYTVTNKAGKSPSTVFLDAGGALVRVENTDGTVVKFSRFNAIDPIVPPN
jgi:hypothetical protein